MLHDNIDDVLSRPDLYPTLKAKREAILRIMPIYLHHNHEPQDHYAEYHGMAMVEHTMRAMGPLVEKGYELPSLWTNRFTWAATSS